MKDSTVTETVDRYLREEVYPESAMSTNRESAQEQRLREDIEQMTRTLVLRVLLSDGTRDDELYKCFAQDVLKITKGR